MKTDKPFKTIDEQIEILKEQRHLLFQNEEAAKHALQRYGYYEVINGYKTPFLNDPNDDDKGYKTDASFENILALYKFDRNLRKDILQSLEYFEQTLKQALAYTVAEEISENLVSYAAISHYNTGSSHSFKGRKFNDRSRLLKKFEKLSHSNNQPFLHYREDHNNIPPWIMIKGLTFGETIYWYRLSKPNVRFKVMGNLLGLDPLLIKTANKELKISQMIGDLLSLYLSYRNLSAHGGRIYNHRSELYKLRWLPLIYPNLIDIDKKSFNHGYFRSSVGVVMRTLKIFDNPEPFEYLNNQLRKQLNDYSKVYSQDLAFLLENLELDNSHTGFSLEENVYIM